MRWNYVLGASVLLMVYAVFAHSPIPAVLGGIGLVTIVKLASIQLLRRFPGRNYHGRDTNV
jgi:hypothetical protein